MYPWCLKFCIFIFSLSLGVQGNASPEKGLELAKKSDKAHSGFLGDKVTMNLVLISVQKKEVVREIVSKVKEGEAEEGDRSIITFIKPADVKGTKLLTWGHKKKNDDQWLYLPALKRVKRISSRRKTGAFMGSEFSYEDLGSQEVEKYTYNYLKDDKKNGRDVWVIERFPIEKNSGYKKQVVYMDKEYLTAIALDYYDRKGELLKVSNLSDWRKVEKFWRPFKIEVFNEQSRKGSRLEVKSMETFQKFSKVDFTKGKLK